MSRERAPRNLAHERAQRALARAPRGAPATVLARAVQAVLGCVPPAVWPLVAARAGCGEDELRAIVADSPDLSAEPRAHSRVTVCTGRTCSRLGGAGLLRTARRLLGVNVFETSADGAIHLEPFSCFGECAMAPNIRIDGSTRGAMTESRLLLLLDMLRRRAASRAAEGDAR